MAMFSPTKLIIGITIFLIVIVLGLISLPNIRSDSIPAPLTEIYKDKKIEVGSGENNYTVGSNNLYAKDIEINNTKLFLVVEKHQDQGSIYRFYPLSDQPKLLKEIISFISPENSNQVFNENLFKKDITNDELPEIFIKVEQNAQGLHLYEILQWNGTSLVSIKKKGEDNSWIDFDDINYKNGYVVMTWHGINERGQTAYLLEGSTLRAIKSVVFSFSNEEEGSCTIKEKIENEIEYKTIEHKKDCDIWTEDLDRYF